ncbi:P-loop ATPase, Sll1717 family [Mycoplana rhizolycopersici]|uniref:DNA repair ATPase n=1 Tax=Mycoplana rhizolycopersici TaxID=2746702 RepID=A0ABX2QKK8_9HYPH|nr:DNA repair ATPase [Rhizobium rhizolycopersici]NVP57911.1 DNA repair ATPase [Rhizobium rhizolycopersici]
MAKYLRKSSNPIILRPDANIGNSSAEADDEFLFDCFFDHPSLAVLRDLSSAKLFASGRTGIGKTALLRMIARKSEHVSHVDLTDLALNYVANSDIIQFLNAIDLDLDLFYQTLWKHVLCIEFIRLRFNVDDSDASRFAFSRLFEIFSGDARKKAALDYLREWESRFWITMDENIKEITQKVESTIDAELSAEVEKFKGRAGYARTLSAEKKSALTHRAKKIVNSELLTDLSKVLDLLSEYDGKDRYSSNYYILIDKLDEKWVDDRIRYQLIRALIECLRSFRKVRNLKVIVALRSDVLERVVQESSHAGFQREKYDDYFLRIRWTKDQLWQLVEKRINFLFRRKYSSENIFFYDVFEKKVGGKDSFDYMIERTLLRPRDIISYINICLSLAQGQDHVSQKIIRQAESEYSRIRLQALTQEWESSYPSIKIAFNLISGRGGRFKPGDISGREFIEEFILEVDDKIQSDTDPIAKHVRDYLRRESPEKLLTTARLLFSTLYRIGAGGLKLAPNEPYLYAYKDVSVVLPEAITGEAKFIVHPMLHRALNISEHA